MTKMNALILTTLLALCGASSLTADEAAHMTIGDLYKDHTALGGKQVTVQGQVVKVNAGIMQRNFIHIQDGSGEAADGTNNLVVTTQDMAAVGDKVTVSGTVVVDQDFGFGYHYPLLVEEASVTKTE
jgi:hypothetical protein